MRKQKEIAACEKNKLLAEEKYEGGIIIVREEKKGTGRVTYKIQGDRKTGLTKLALKAL